MRIGLKFSCNFAFIMSTLLLHSVRLYILRSNGRFAKIARISQSLGKSDSFVSVSNFWDRISHVLVFVGWLYKTCKALDLLLL